MPDGTMTSRENNTSDGRRVALVEDAMMKFRNGDVVCLGAYRSRCRANAIVVHVDDDGDPIVRSPNGVEWPCYATDVSLLRRPALVGDVLRRHSDGRTETVRRVWARGVDFEFGNSHRTLFDVIDTTAIDYWTHADGTPIEPPQAEATHGAKMMAAKERVTFSCKVPLPNEQEAIADWIEWWRGLRKSLPTAERLARALFETDERVIAFINERSEAKYEPGKPTEEEGRLPAWERATSIAWGRNEHGWRSEAEQRAGHILEVLRSAK